jgi:hypothetical protein
MKPFAFFPVLRITKAELNPDNTITIYRNDRRKAIIAKRMDPSEKLFTSSAMPHLH